MKILAISFQPKAGKFLVQTTGENIWVSPKQWQAKGLLPTTSAYVGGDIYPSYYEEGDTLVNGGVCEKSGVLLQDFTIVMNAEIAGNAAAAAAKDSFDFAMAVAAKRTASRKQQQSTKPAESAESAEPVSAQPAEIPF